MNFFNKLMEKFSGLPEDDLYEMDDNIDNLVEDKEAKSTVDSIFSSGNKDFTFSGSKVTSINTPTSQQMVVVKPRSTEAARDISVHLKAGRIVICNFNECDVDKSQRIIDFVTGSAFCMGSSLQKLEENIFLIYPKEVHLINNQDTQAQKSYSSYTDDYTSNVAY